MTSQHPRRVWPPEGGHPPAVVGASVVPPQPPSAQALRWAALTAGDVMRKDVVTVPPSCGLVEVERILTEKRISGAPVMDPSGKVVGIVSLRDLVERYAEDPDARPKKGRVIEALPLEDDFGEEEETPFATADLDSELTAADVMTAEVHWVPATAGLGDIARAMVQNRVHRVLVRDGERYVGLIGTLDVLDALAG